MTGQPPRPQRIEGTLTLHTGDQLTVAGFLTDRVEDKLAV